LVEGWAMHNFEDYNLYPSRSAACSGRGEKGRVGAEWDDSHLKYRSMRKGQFEATFKNELFVQRADGSFLVSNSMTFGPLKDIRVLRWESAEWPPCRKSQDNKP
ncbi:MAG: hypothetical protein VYD00_00135, partial [Pseudomonadota bacterium]|nr:hypothetical protein [Pseudomonadota bacterium]